MIRQQLEQYLFTQGFIPLPTNLKELSAFVKVERNFVNILQLIDYENNLYLSAVQYEEIKEAIKKSFQEKGLDEIHILSVILAENVERARQLAPQDRFCWILDMEAQQLLIEEGKMPDFYGMKTQLLTFLDAYRQDPNQSFGLEEQTSVREPSFKEKVQQYLKHMPAVTVGIIGVNILIYLLCLTYGNQLYSMGELGLELVKNGGWYRLFTATLLHADLDHIFSNMLLLYFLGNMLESQLGRARYFTIYLFAGILGNVVSCIYEAVSGIHYVSFGASGAVYGLIGAVLFLVIKGNKALHISKVQMLLMVIYCIYSSFAGQNINAAAHIGGLVFGLILTFILNPGRSKHED